jgi:hypothetical protein
VERFKATVVRGVLPSAASVARRIATPPSLIVHGALTAHALVMVIAT